MSYAEICFQFLLVVTSLDLGWTEEKALSCDRLCVEVKPSGRWSVSLQGTSKRFTK